MCDFLPENPKSPVTATELLFGGATKGILRVIVNIASHSCVH